MADALLPTPEPNDDSGDQDETELETEIDCDQGANAKPADGEAADAGVFDRTEGAFRTPTPGDRLTSEELAEEL